MGRMISAALSALLWAGIFATGALAARPPLPGQKPAELRIEALLRDARNAEALALAERQVQQAQTKFGADRPQTAAALNTLADILGRYARYAEAEEKARAALAVHEAALGADAPETAASLNVLGAIATERGRYKEAAPLLERALAINERARGSEHAATADSLAAIASLRRRLLDAPAAEPLARRALAIREKALGDHPDTADSAELLGALLVDQNRRTDAEPLMQRARLIRSGKLAAGHTDLANSFQWEGYLLQLDGKLAEAESPMQRALAICTTAFGVDHPCTGYKLSTLGGLHEAQGKPQQAEVAYSQALAAYEASYKEDNKDIGLALLRLGRLYQKTSRPREAEAAFTRTLGIFEAVYGTEHSETLYALRDLANALNDQGRYPEAGERLERALAMSRKLFGDEHRETFNSLIPLTANYAARGQFAQAEQSLKQALALAHKLNEPSANLETFQSSLAIIYSFQNRHTEAEALLRELLDGAEKNYGNNDVRTAKAINSLALNYAVQARYREAEGLYRREIAIRETVQGPSHLETIKSIEALASLLIHSARFTDAEKLLMRVLAAREAGGETLALGDVLGSLGRLYEQMARYQQSEQAYRRALAIDEKLEPNTFYLTSNLINLAGLLSKLARYSEAEALYKRALAIAQETLEPDHPQLGKFLNNLGASYKEQGRFDEATELNRRALEIYEKHKSDLATPLNNRASLYAEQGRYAEAEQLQRQALAENERRLGPEHPEVATSLHNLASSLSEQGRFDEVGPLILRAIAIDEKAYGPTHPDVANKLGSLANLRSDQGRHAEAEQHYRRALTMYEAVFGAEHPDTARSYHNLGTFYSETGRTSDGVPLLRRARAIWEETLGVENPSTLVAIANLASALNTQKQDPEAESLYKLAIDLRVKVLGEDHPDTAMALNNLAAFYLDQRRFEDAVVLLERALPIVEERLGDQHPVTAVVLRNTGLCLMELKKYAEAGPILSRALAIQQRVLGQDHPETAQALTSVAALNEKAGVDVAGAYALNQQATAVIIRLARRESGRLDEVEGARGRSELTGHANIFIRQARIGWRLAGQAPERAAALLDEGFQVAQWAHQSAAAAALSQMTSRLANDEGELPLLVRRRQDLVWRYRALDRQLIAASATPAEARDAAVEAGLRKDMEHLDASIRTLDLTLKASFPDYAALANPEPLTVAEAQAQLREGEVLYQISIGRDTSIAWAITSGEARWQEVPIGEDALKDEVEALRCGLDESIWDPDPKARERMRARYDRCKALLGREPEKWWQPPFDLDRAHALYQTLFAPFEALIANRQLLFVPSGPLTTLPLHVLVTQAPSEDDARSEIEQLAQASWLGKRQAITVLPSVPSLKAARDGARPSVAANPFIGFANPLLLGGSGTDRRAWQKQSCRAELQPVPDPGDAERPVRMLSDLDVGAKVDLASLRVQPPLPETADEACAVARSLGAGDADVHLGSRASEAALKKLSQGGALKTYRVVHFATHGLIAGETARFLRSRTEPSLLMTPPDFADEMDDGLLTASEIAELSLDAEAVVLSACNTASTSGTPEAEALSGLARAFFYAGARALLVTHWYVNSVAAVELVTGAFGELKREPGLKLAEAMRRAMTVSIEAGGERAHPAFWAPFVVVAAN